MSKRPCIKWPFTLLSYCKMLSESWHFIGSDLFLCSLYIRHFGSYWYDSTMMQILFSHHIPKVDWDLDLVPLGVQRAHCHVSETSLRLFDLCNMFHYPPGSSNQKFGTIWSKRDGHGQQNYSGSLWHLNTTHYTWYTWLLIDASWGK